MSLATVPTTQRAETTRLLTAGALTLFVVLVAVPLLFVGLGDSPLQLWDEARPALHALEMAFPTAERSVGERLLIPFYNGEPESWHLKPPMMTWMSAAAIRTLGPSEFALRLPSALSALLTAVALLWFCSARLGAPVGGAVAAIALLTTRGFMAEHVALTADYDALLTLWTTCYGLAAFCAIESNASSNRKGWVLVFWCAVTAAVLTKGVQALIFMPAIFAYAGVQRKGGAFLRSPAFWAGGATCLAVVGAYYVLRESYQPGYLEAVLHHEVLGRYAEGVEVEGHRRASYYLRELVAWQGAPWLLVLPGGVAAATMLGGEGTKKAARYTTLLLAFYLAVISFAATKHPWYLAPAFPFIALLIGIGASSLVRQFEGRLRVYGAVTVGVLLCVPLFDAVRDAVERRGEPVAPWTAGSRSEVAEAEYLRRVIRRTEIASDEQSVHFISEGYNGSLEYYAAVAERTGLDVRISTELPLGNAFVARCESRQIPTAEDEDVPVVDRWVDATGLTSCVTWQHGRGDE